MNISRRQESLTRCLKAIDLTTLKNSDTPQSIKAFVENLVNTHQAHPELALPASICVYPNMAKIVKEELKKHSEEIQNIHVTVVSGCFPASQSFLEVKEMETKMALAQGADEVDIVLALNAFFDEDYNRCVDEIKAIKKHCASATLKVILETGTLQTEENIRKASFLAMEAGADFIKTSTGKVETGATPMAAIIMCQCIKEYYEKTGIKVGVKVAGGISELEDALIYHDIVRDTLGTEWLDSSLFRIGASRLFDKIIKALA